MSDKEKKSIKWLDKLKNIKHIEVYIAILFVVVLLLIYFSTKTTNDKRTLEKTNDSSVSAYIANLETNLEDILSNIAGVSNVKVMITINLSDLEVSNSQISLTKFPAIRGVLVTAKGVNNTANKLKILHAIEAVVEVNNGNIEILSSE